MSEMIERVANALRAACLKEFGSDWNNDVARGFARVAIKAMREPTAEMRKLDESLAPFWDHSTAPPTLQSKLGAHTGASWQDMIDAALK